jgi:hypothetical protein
MWWELERKNFDLYSSRIVEKELLNGIYANQFQAIAAARRMLYLPPSEAIDRCHDVLMSSGLFPKSEFVDALHLAYSIINRVDYLLTWNQAHLANASVQRKLKIVARKHGWRPPLLVSPEAIPWASMGGEIRNMIRQPELIDENVEDIRRVRREISAQFKTRDEFIAYIYKIEKEGLQRERRERAAKRARREKLAAAKVGIAKKVRKVM